MSGIGTVGRYVALMLLAIAQSMLAAASASAQSCTLSGLSDLNFGSVDLTDNTAYDTQSTFQIDCDGGTPGQTLRVCPNLGAGGGGANGANAPRYLSGSLGYNIYRDAGRSSVWGSYLGGGSTPEYLITLDGGGSGSASGTMYARLFAGQQSLPPASYLSAFSGAPHAVLNWAVDTGADCGAIGGSNPSPFSFQALASYLPTCRVSGGSMDFGLIPSLASPIDASVAISARCSASTPYTVSLNDGLSPSGLMMRRMNNGAEMMRYDLYKNAGRTAPWGSDTGFNVAATGSGSSQSYTVFGRIPAQITPPVGTYTDTVLITVSY